MPNLPLDAIGQLCRKYSVRELALFGSAARGEEHPDSDIDFLVDFDPGARVGLIEYEGLRQELESLVARPVDLVSKRGLRPRLRETVLADARVLYAA